MDNNSMEDLLKNHHLYRIGYKYGSFLYKYRYAVVVVWILLFLACIPFAIKLPSKLSGGGYSLTGSESYQATQALQGKLGQNASELFVVFTSESTYAKDPRYIDEVNKVKNDLNSKEHVSAVKIGGVGNDGKSTYISIGLNSSSLDIQQQIPDFKKTIQDDATNGPAKAYLTGSIAIFNEINQVSISDTKKADAASLPIALIVLLIVFGTILAAFMPLMLAVIAVLASLALLYPIAIHQELNSVVLELTSIIGLGLSIDYSLFMVRRFREELTKSKGIADAIGWTIATSGEAILFSGSTVMIGFLGMLFIGIEFMTSVGIAGAIVVLSAVITALTLLPAVLTILGNRINSWKIPYFGKRIAEKNYEGKGFWHNIARFVMANPVKIFISVILALVLFGYPLLFIKIGTPGVNSLPSSSDSYTGLNILNTLFKDLNSQAIFLVVSSSNKSILNQNDLQSIDSLSKWLSGVNGVSSVISLTRIPNVNVPTPSLVSLYSNGRYTKNPVLSSFASSISNGSYSYITVKTNYSLDSTESVNLLKYIRSNYSTHAGTLNVLVGGQQATNYDFNSYLFDNFPRAIIFILSATFILLLIMFRSILIPLKAVIVNTLSISAAYGVLVVVFQWGWGQSLLKFTSEGFIESIIPIFMFCILFGLSMDYEVFLLSRIREEWLKTKDNTEAVAYGLEHTGGVITSAALLLIIVAGSIAMSSIISTKEMGLGITVAVFVDATIIRTLLVPATMKLLGPLNWWFPWGKSK